MYTNAKFIADKMFLYMNESLVESLRTPSEKYLAKREEFLLIEEFPVDSFCKNRVYIPKKYMVKQGIKVSN